MPMVTQGAYPPGQPQGAPKVPNADGDLRGIPTRTTPGRPQSVLGMSWGRPGVPCTERLRKKLLFTEALRNESLCEERFCNEPLRRRGNR